MRHDPLPPKKKPFYRRAWFIGLAVLALLGLVAAGFGAIYLREEFHKKAAELDITKLRDMESASIVYDRHERILGKIYIQNRDTIDLDRMAGDLVPALVAAEDNRFFQHPGIDVIGMARALLKDIASGRIRQGASTITQQLARNTFPEALPASDRSIRRKLLEAFVAFRIEEHYTKSEILEFYFNRVYFGSGFYGVEAAAHGYFGKSAHDLTLSECATLTGMLRSPNNLSPWRDRGASISIRNFVLGRMLELGYIAKADYDAAIAEELNVKNRKPIYAESYAVEFVRQQVAELIGNKESIYGEGYRIHTTIDADLQRTAETSLRTRLEEVENRSEFGRKRQTFAQYDRLLKEKKGSAPGSPTYLQGALYAIDNSTGGVLALVGGRSFRHNQFNRALFANRPPGTAFLPLVYAAAFEKGIFPGSLFQDSVIDNRQVMIGGTTGVLGEWGPERADNQYEGPISAHDALVKSKNAATVRLGMSTGLENVLSLAKKAGIDSELRPYPATFLGSSEVTLEDLTLAYTMFPNGGTRPGRPFVVQRVVQKDGVEIYRQPDYEPVQVIAPTTAYEVHSALSDALEWGSADKASLKYGLKKFQLGGKTGTAYNFTDVLFVGYSSAITCGVWAGFDAPQQIYRGGFSNEIALPIWVDFMNASFKEYPAKPIYRPPGMKKYEICRRSGLLAIDRCVDTTTVGEETIATRTTAFEWGTPAQAPQETCDVHGDGTPRVVTDIDAVAPRALPARSYSDQITPIFLKAATVVGDDPYGAIRNSTVMVAQPADPDRIPPVVPPTAPGDTGEEEENDGEPQIRRAQRVRTLDERQDASTIQLEAPPALEF